MEMMRKGLVLLLALVLAMGLALSLAPAANAAVLILEPGDSTTLVIEYSKAWGVEGSIAFSDSSIVKVEIVTADSGMVGLCEKNQFFFYTDKPEGASGKIVIRITMLSSTPVGAATSVDLRYAITDAESNTPGETQIISSFLVAYKAATEPAPTPPPNVVTLDNSALVAQLRRVYSLTPSDYTQESWSVVDTALQAGLGALNSGSQSQIDAAAVAMKYALDYLEPVDYSDLDATLDSLSYLEDMEEISAQWTRFVTAVNQANAAKASGDQAAVDAAVEELLASKEELLAALTGLREIVEVEKEVEVVVEKIVEKVVTETVYVEEVIECGKWSHKLYLILMIVFGVISLALGTLVIIYFVKKRRAHKDKTPLVEYNIEDDGAPTQ